MISLVVAYSKNKVIGKDGSMPWDIPGELTRFKKLTSNNVVIMGRKTYESIGHPLENRITYVISKSKNYTQKDTLTFSSLSEAISVGKSTGKDIFIAGGEEIFSLAIPLVDTMYITVIDAYIEGDRFFPNFDTNEFEITLNERINNSTIPYTYYTYIRKK